MHGVGTILTTKLQQKVYVHEVVRKLGTFSGKQPAEKNAEDEKAVADIGSCPPQALEIPSVPNTVVDPLCTVFVDEVGRHF